jgi:hypothetical protein
MRLKTDSGFLASDPQANKRNFGTEIYTTFRSVWCVHVNMCLVRACAHLFVCVCMTVLCVFFRMICAYVCDICSVCVYNLYVWHADYAPMPMPLSVCMLSLSLVMHWRAPHVHNMRAHTKQPLKSWRGTQIIHTHTYRHTHTYMHTYIHRSKSVV